MTQTIDAAAFQQMVIHAAAAISAQKQHINDLNVFPSPRRGYRDQYEPDHQRCRRGAEEKAVCHRGRSGPDSGQRPAAGARGNSGVILSLLFRGFAKAVKDKDTMDGRDLAIALDFGVAAAYKAVMKPAEGTILTVSRLAAAQAAAAAREENAAESVLEAAIRRGRKPWPTPSTRTRC